MALENKNNELLQSLEAREAPVEKSTNFSRDSHDSTLAGLQSELEQTKRALTSAQAKLEEDDSVVVKWEGKDANTEIC